MQSIRDAYCGDLVHNAIELLQCPEERRNPINKSNRIIGAVDCGRHTLDGRSNNAHLRDGFLCGFNFLGCRLASVTILNSMLLVRLDYYRLQHKSHIYRFRMFEQASYFLQESGSRLKRRCRGVLRDQCEYDSQLGMSGGGEKHTCSDCSSSRPRWEGFDSGRLFFHSFGRRNR